MSVTFHPPRRTELVKEMEKKEQAALHDARGVERWRLAARMALKKEFGPSHRRLLLAMGEDVLKYMKYCKTTALDLAQQDPPCVAWGFKTTEGVWEARPATPTPVTPRSADVPLILV